MDSHPSQPDFENDLRALVQQRRKIEAIEMYREETGVGLKEAKDAAEAFALKRGLILQGGGYVDGLALLLAVGGALAILPLVIAQEA